MAMYSERFKAVYRQHLAKQFEAEKISQNDITGVLISFSEFISLLSPEEVLQILQRKYKKEDTSKHYQRWTIVWANKINEVADMCFTLTKREVTEDDQAEDFLNDIKGVLNNEDGD